MENNNTIHPETSQPDFAAFAAAVRTRVAQRQILPPAALEGLTRLGRLVQTLRTKQHWSLQTLAAQTGLSWLWLALLEQGMLLPTELTPEAVQQLGQVFPTQHAVTRPEVLFHTLVEDLLHSQVASPAVEQLHSHRGPAVYVFPLPSEADFAVAAASEPPDGVQGLPGEVMYQDAELEVWLNVEEGRVILRVYGEDVHGVEDLEAIDDKTLAPHPVVTLTRTPTAVAYALGKTQELRGKRVRLVLRLCERAIDLPYVEFPGEDTP